VKLRNTNIGVFIKIPSTQVLEIALAAGFDFCLIDLEHSQLGQAEAMRLASHAKAIGLPALARVATVDPDLVNRLLEAGCRGIQLSTVRTAAQVRELRAATRYAPTGTRSISLAHRGAGFGTMPMSEYLAAEEAEPPLAIAQIETATTDDPLEDILAAGPDAVFIGTADLRADVGLDEEAFAARVAEISEAAERAGIVLGAIGLEDPRITYRVLSSDLALLHGAAATAVAAARS
jgi:4-hydroxy-2-oxoheptanedioate aldolase